MNFRDQAHEAASPLAKMLFEHIRLREFERQCYDRLTQFHGTPKRWNIIRAYYRHYHDAIMESHKWDPYGIGLERYLTPIEAKLWQDIRPHGLPFLMQYPVGRYFVDFGDPRQQIAIECDGKQWHDAEKDAERDRQLRALGWTVYRVKGYECNGDAGTQIIKEIAGRYYCRCYDCQMGRSNDQ